MIKKYYDHPTIPNLQAIDVIQDFPYNIGTAMAYLWRAHTGKPGVDPIEDLRKCLQHVEFEIKRIEAQRKKD
jgi:hypothetical protein